MKKLLTMVVWVLVFVCLFVSCNKPNDNQSNNSNDNQSVHSHSFGEWEITTEPTCTEEGQKTCYCDCGETQCEAVPMLGHNEIIDAAVSSLSRDLRLKKRLLISLI